MEQEPRKPQLENIEIDEEQEWQDLIDSIEATEVPLEMLKYLRIHLTDGQRMIFPIIKWLDEGEDIEKVKDIVSKWYRKNNHKVAGSDFVVNLTKLKDTVKSQTERTLKDL